MILFDLISGNEGALGMESRRIKNGQFLSNYETIGASTEYAWEARLNNNLHWLSTEGSYYLEVKLLYEHLLTHISTQGRTCCTNYVKSYSVEVMDGTEYWTYYKENKEVKVYVQDNMLWCIYTHRIH